MELLIGFLLGIATNAAYDFGRYLAGKARARLERNHRRGKHSR